MSIVCVCVCVCVCVSRSAESDSAISWTVVYQAPLSMEFSSQEYWSRLQIPSPGDLPDPGIEQCIAGRLFTIWVNREILYVNYISIKIKSLKIAQEDKLFLEMTRKDSASNFKRVRLKRVLHKKWGEYLTMRLSQFNSGNKHWCNTAVTRHQASADCKGI